ncbi:MAG: uroporphyrinogen-III synthase [Burkholderiaceae bacterium]|nr:uroporphyrinogen-III synthase [Burkholderiaceae bacterium]
MPQLPPGLPPQPLPRLLVTRPQPQADEWVARLQALGLQAAALPLLAIGDAPQATAVPAAWATLPGRALVMFVSPTAVQRFFAGRPAGAAWPAGTLAGSTGPGTAAALRAQGLAEPLLVTPPDDAPRFDSEALWLQLQQRRPPPVWPGARVLIVRGEGGRDWLAGTLAEAGAQVDFVEAYRRQPPRLDAAGQALLAAAVAAPQAHAWLVSSSEALGHLARLAPAADWSAACALATHPRIAESAQALGFGRVHRVSPSPLAVRDLLQRLQAGEAAGPAL